MFCTTIRALALGSLSHPSPMSRPHMPHVHSSTHELLSTLFKPHPPPITASRRASSFRQAPPRFPHVSPHPGRLRKDREHKLTSACHIPTMCNVCPTCANGPWSQPCALEMHPQSLYGSMASRHALAPTDTPWPQQTYHKPPRILHHCCHYIWPPLHFNHPITTVSMCHLCHMLAPSIPPHKHTHSYPCVF